MKAMNYSAIFLAVLSATTVANAAGLDRSGQDVSAFLQDGTYAEAVYTYVDANISGNDNGVPAGASTSYSKGNATGDISKAYDFFRFGAKADISDSLSVGVLYDEPFGASVHHSGNSNFVSQGGDTTISALTANSPRPISTLPLAKGAQNDLQNAIIAIPKLQAGIAGLNAQIQQAQNTGNTAQVTALQGKQTQLQTQLDAINAQTGGLEKAKQTLARLNSAINIADTAETQKGQGTTVDIQTNNFTALLGIKLGENKNLQIYGGPALQRLTGNVSLRGTAYQGATGYDARIVPNVATGWVAGIAYSKPEIALKAALTYRSDIKHTTNISETFPATSASALNTFSVTLPKSYNLDFQTGLSAKHRLLGTAKVRHVPWSQFSIRPPVYGDVTLATQGVALPIASYSKDQWTAEIGLGKQLSDKLSVAGNVGWDSGAGDPTTTLGPVKGHYSVGLGAKYNLTQNLSLSLGGKYLKFGDATAQLPNGLTAGKFADNDGYVVGLKVAYQDK